MAVMDDVQVIDMLGGPTALARLLGYSLTDGGVQRVGNWRRRGIPPKVKLEHPEVFGEAALRRLADGDAQTNCNHALQRRPQPIPITRPCNTSGTEARGSAVINPKE